METFLFYFVGGLTPATALELVSTIPQFLTSGSPSFWLIFVFPFARYVLPALSSWIVYHTRPELIDRPLGTPLLQVGPLVSFVIAGRNEAASIGIAIRSILHAGYRNVEVIFVDDGSYDDSVAAAKHAAVGMRGDHVAVTQRVRVLVCPRRNGKATALSIGVSVARGEFIAILDSDSQVQFGAIHHWLAPFADPSVGAVAANLRVRNAGVSFLTCLQECEYANASVSRLAASLVDLLNIVPGAAGMFRGDILRTLGAYDTGLGDDTDMTLKIRKQRWRLAYAVRAFVWTDVPVAWSHLFKQRIRWERNMVKIRVSKHRDMFVLGRYGLHNAILTVDLLIFRFLLPWTALVGVLIAVRNGPLRSPEIVTSIYWVYLFWLLIKALIARDISSTPQVQRFPFLFAYPFYKVIMRIVTMVAFLRELLRIGLKHRYVPDHIWEETPHW